jgi:predicted acylesterase/phospholipase RssA
MANAIRRHIPSRGVHNCRLTSIFLEGVFNLLFYQGHEFNRSLYKAFYDLHIEDMWLPFFCNTANITTSRMEIHETGYAWRFIRKPRRFTLFVLTNNLL